MTGSHDDTLRKALSSATIKAIAQSGLGSVSLRAVAAAAGRSTTAVFHHYGDKAGLLAAAAEQALQAEQRFHDMLRDSLSGMPLDPRALGMIVADYVHRRARDGSDALNLWPELLFNVALWPEGARFVGLWQDLLVGFWQPLLDAAGLSDFPARFLVAYLIMEMSYAGIAAQDAGMSLLIQETASTLFDGGAQHPIVRWKETTAAPPALLRNHDQDGLSRRLLDIAAREILEKGVTTLTHRRLTALAGVSPAMIIYHFGDMATLESAAIWQALLSGLPAYLNSSVEHAAHRQDMDAWVASLQPTLVPATPDRPAGFYVGYARIVGQTCLIARRNPAFVPLVNYLRAIEGIGIFNAGQTIWPERLRLSRGRATCFALWAKGYASLNEACGRDAGAVERELLHAAKTFPETGKLR